MACPPLRVQERGRVRRRSAVDGAWDALAMGASLLVVIAVWGAPGVPWWARALLIVGVPGLMAWLRFATWYELREDHLYGRSGPFVERIPYRRIRSLRLCENRWSSMALSPRRIEIRQHGRGWLTGTTYISPVDRDAFLEELRRRCPALEERAVQ